MRAFILAVTGFGFIVVAACSSYGTSVVEVENQAEVASVSIALPSPSLVAGQTQRGHAIVKDATGATLSGRAVTWFSSSTSIATVNDAGDIAAVTPGSATLSAVSEGVAGTAALTVIPRPPMPVAKVLVAINPAAVVVGQTAQASVALQDADGNPLSDRAVAWQSGNASVAVVSGSGAISAVGAGSTSITASSEGQAASASLSVSAPAPVPVATVTVAPATATLQIGATVQLAATTRDASGATLTGRVVGWSSANAGVASVNSNGLVSAVGAGTAQITASSEGKTSSATITVSAPPPPPSVPVATVSISPSSQSLVIGATVQLAATTRDANGAVLTGRAVSWSSASGAIATVSTSGLVRGIAAGTVQITATSEGKSSSASITVTPPVVTPVATVTVSPATSSPIVGNTVQLSATTRDANGNVLNGRVVVWSTANAAIASVNATSGLVTTVAVGTVQITATSETKTGTATFNVQAVPPPPPPGSSNEPTGMTRVAERSFNAVQESPWDTDSQITVVQDATAPKSPSSALRFTFPTGFGGGGNSNGHTGLAFGGNYRILYISYWAKYSANWYGHETGINKQAYAWVTAGYTPFVMEAEGTGSGSLRPRPILQRMIRGDGNYSPNLVPGAVFPRGAWFRVEIVLTGNTSGSANGAMDLWLDGVKVGSWGGLQWTSGTTAWNVFELYPVWGGVGSISVPSTMTWDIDHTYLSGKN
jgi:uncharacterized protein YjdB